MNLCLSTRHEKSLICEIRIFVIFFFCFVLFAVCLKIGLSLYNIAWVVICICIVVGLLCAYKGERLCRASIVARGSVVLRDDPANSQQVNTSTCRQLRDTEPLSKRLCSLMLSSVLELPHHLMSLPVTTKPSR